MDCEQFAEPDEQKFGATVSDEESASTVSGIESSDEGRSGGQSNAPKVGKLRYLIFPWGNSMGCFHDVFKARSDQWEEFSYEEADVDKPRTWDAHFVWKIRRQGLTGYKHTEGPPPKSFGRGEGKQLQVLNYMPHFKDIMSKTGLVNVAKKYAQVRKVEWPNFLPISYCLSPFWVQEMNEEGQHPLKSTQIEDFIVSHRQCASGNGKHMSKHCEKNMWLIKPASGNRGIGIEVFTKISEVKAFLRESERWKLHWIIQKYIEKPLLLNKKKFDIRCWFLIKSPNDGSDGLEGYYYEDWYVRLSSEAFSTNTNDRYVHLTNYAVQKKHPNFSQQQDGNTWSQYQFKEYLKRHCPAIAFESIQEDIEHVLRTTAQMVYTCHARTRGKSVSPPSLDTKRASFELLGYDFMVDDFGKVWMLEANGNPALSYQSDMHETLVKNMIGEMIDITCSGIPGFKTRTGKDQKTQFKKIFDSKIDLDEFSTIPDELIRPIDTAKQKRPLPPLVPAHRFAESTPRQRFPRASSVFPQKSGESKSPDGKSKPKPHRRELQLPKRKPLYKPKNKYVSVLDRAKRASEAMCTERLAELKKDINDLKDIEQRGFTIPSLISPLFVPPTRKLTNRCGKRKASLGGRKLGFSLDLAQNRPGVSSYQVQRQRQPFLQFFETSPIRGFQHQKKAPSPSADNKWFQSYRAKRLLASPRPWSGPCVSTSPPKPHGNTIELDEAFEIPYRVILNGRGMEKSITITDVNPLVGSFRTSHFPKQ